MSNLALPDNPTSKYGEALHAQVEERLNFFETGAPPSKNADAMRKVLESLSLDNEDEDEDEDVDMDAEPALTTLVPTPKKEKKKKRKIDAMDVDGDDSADEPSAKKAKLSKEEKKALKKAKKEAKKAKTEHKAMATTAVCYTVFPYSCLIITHVPCLGGRVPEEKEREKGEEGEEGEKGEGEKTQRMMMPSSFSRFVCMLSILFSYFRFVSRSPLLTSSVKILDGNSRPHELNLFSIITANFTLFLFL